MSCKDFWEKELAGRLAGPSRVAPGQVDGGQRCTRPGCDALVNRAAGRCVKGHSQGVTEAGYPQELDALLCLAGELRDRGLLSAVDEGRVVAIQDFSRTAQEQAAGDAGQVAQEGAEAVVALVNLVERAEFALSPEESATLHDDPRVRAGRSFVHAAALESLRQALGPLGDPEGGAEQRVNERLAEGLAQSALSPTDGQCRTLKYRCQTGVTFVRSMREALAYPGEARTQPRRWLQRLLGLRAMAQMCNAPVAEPREEARFRAVVSDTVNGMYPGPDPLEDGREALGPLGAAERALQRCWRQVRNDAARFPLALLRAVAAEDGMPYAQYASRQLILHWAANTTEHSLYREILNTLGQGRHKEMAAAGADGAMRVWRQGERVRFTDPDGSELRGELRVCQLQITSLGGSASHYAGADTDVLVPAGNVLLRGGPQSGWSRTVPLAWLTVETSDEL